MLHGSLQKIKEERGKDRLRLKTSATEDTLYSVLSPHGLKDLKKDKLSYILHMAENTESDAILRPLLEEKIPIESFSPYYPTLTDIFVETAGEK